MSKAKKAAVPDRARATIRAPKRNDSDKVNLAKTLKAVMPQSPHFAQATDTQQALTALGTKADAIATNVATIAALRQQLATAEGALVLLRRDYGLALGHLVSTVQVFAGGSADVISSLGLQVQGSPQRAPYAAPDGLLVTTGSTAGTVSAVWKKGSASHGFVVQHATDVANTATYSALQPSTKSRCTISGLVTGTVVHVRVAAVDPRAQSVQSPWTDWATATVR